MPVSEAESESRWLQVTWRGSGGSSGLTGTPFSSFPLQTLGGNIVFSLAQAEPALGPHSSPSPSGEGTGRDTLQLALSPVEPEADCEAGRVQESSKDPSRGGG